MRQVFEHVEVFTEVIEILDPLMTSQRIFTVRPVHEEV